VPLSVFGGPDTEDDMIPLSTAEEIRCCVDYRRKSGGITCWLVDEWFNFQHGSREIAPATLGVVDLFIGNKACQLRGETGATLYWLSQLGCVIYPGKLTEEPCWSIGTVG
jgi:hypothetical protein